MSAGFMPLPSESFQEQEGSSLVTVLLLVTRPVRPLLSEIAKPAVCAGCAWRFWLARIGEPARCPQGHVFESAGSVPRHGNPGRKAPPAVRVGLAGDVHPAIALWVLLLRNWERLRSLLS